EVAVLVDPGAIAREVRVRVLRPVGLFVALVVLVDPAQHGGPRPAKDEVAASAGTDLVPLLVVDGRVDGRKRLRRRAGLRGRYTRQRRDQDHSGLGLPPGVDDRRAVAADVLSVPDPGLRVDRLSDRTE